MMQLITSTFLHYYFMEIMFIHTKYVCINCFAIILTTNSRSTLTTACVCVCVSVSVCRCVCMHVKSVKSIDFNKWNVMINIL